jgi:hypothetical protein
MDPQEPRNGLCVVYEPLSRLQDLDQIINEWQAQSRTHEK